MAPLRTADIVDEAAEFFTQGNKNLILILDRLCPMLESMQRDRRR